jgi:hypothetical protein
MDYSTLSCELGPVTVATHLVAKARNCRDILAVAAQSNPLVPVFHRNGRPKIGAVFHKVLASIKPLCHKKLMILSHQEQDLVEGLCMLYRSPELNVMADASLPLGVLARMRNNFPSRCHADIIQIPDLPQSLDPAETVVLTVGVQAGGGWILVPEHSLNVLDHLRGVYWGERILIDPIGYPIQDRGAGWVPIDEELFTGIASAEGYIDLEAVVERTAA